MRKIVELDMEQCIKLLQETKNIAKTARILGVNENLIYHRLKQKGLTIEGLGARRETGLEHLNKNAGDIVRLLLDKKMELKDIAVEMGVTYGVISTWTRKTGLLQGEIGGMSTKELIDIVTYLECNATNCEWPREIRREPRLPEGKEKGKEKAAAVGEIPSIAEVQREARRRGMSYGHFINSQGYIKWRKAYKKNKAKETA